MSADDLLARFAEFCGPAKYDDFLTAFDQTARRRGRLMYWQEQLWHEFAEASPGDVPTAAQDVFAVFSSLPPEIAGRPRAKAPPRAPTREEFLADPLGYALPEEIPVDWVVEGWTREKFRGDVLYVLARSVSKVGGFDLVHSSWLRALSGALTPEQVVGLYPKFATRVSDSSSNGARSSSSTSMESRSQSRRTPSGSFPPCANSSNRAPWSISSTWSAFCPS